MAKRFVAALFAIHPLHVESVAWISERKDVLSAVFFMLMVGAYIRFVRAPSFTAYMLVLLFFALGLMSKPMLVSVPFVLLLLDYWPLKRFTPERPVKLRQERRVGRPREHSPNDPRKNSVLTFFMPLAQRLWLPNGFSLTRWGICH